MDESKKAEIEKQVRDILDKFGKSLGKVKLNGDKGEKKLGGFRKEGKGANIDSDFKERMFANAPKKEEDYILAETKKW